MGDARIHEPRAGAGARPSTGAATSIRSASWGISPLSGTLPFEADKATEVLGSKSPSPRRRSQPLAGVPRRLGQAIDRCLAKDPAERPEGTRRSRNSSATPGAAPRPTGGAPGVREAQRAARRQRRPHLSVLFDGSRPRWWPGWRGPFRSDSPRSPRLPVVPLGCCLTAPAFCSRPASGTASGRRVQAEMGRGREERAFGVGHKTRCSSAFSNVSAPSPSARPCINVGDPGRGPRAGSRVLHVDGDSGRLGIRHVSVMLQRRRDV